MTDTSRSTRPFLNAIEPQLFVADLARSCDFYQCKLGFAVEWLYGEPPSYGQLSRDHARFNLRLVCEPVFTGDIRRREHLLSATVTLLTAQATRELFAEFRSAGVLFHQELKQEPWGATTFIVPDPDGNLILFAGPAAGQEAS